MVTAALPPTATACHRSSPPRLTLAPAASSPSQATHDQTALPGRQPALAGGAGRRAGAACQRTRPGPLPVSAAAAGAGDQPRRWYRAWAFGRHKAPSGPLCPASAPAMPAGPPPRCWPACGPACRSCFMMRAARPWVGALARAAARPPWPTCCARRWTCRPARICCASGSAPRPGARCLTRCAHWACTAWRLGQQSWPEGLILAPREAARLLLSAEVEPADAIAQASQIWQAKAST